MQKHNADLKQKRADKHLESNQKLLNYPYTYLSLQYKVRENNWYLGGKECFSKHLINLNKFNLINLNFSVVPW